MDMDICPRKWIITRELISYPNFAFQTNYFNTISMIFSEKHVPAVVKEHCEKRSRDCDDALSKIPTELPEVLLQPATTDAPIENPEKKIKIDG